MLQIIGWVLLGILAFFIVLLLMPVRTRVRYSGSLQVWCGLGPVTVRLFPMKRKKKAGKKSSKKAKKEKKERSAKAHKPKQKLTLEQIKAYIHLGVNGLKAMKRRLLVKNLTCHLMVGGEDAAKAALLYGRVSAALSATYPLLEDALRIQKSDIAVDVDFSRPKTQAAADVTVAACPLRLLIAAVILLIQFLKLQKHIKQQAKAAENTENSPSASPSIQQKGGNLNEQHQ